MGISPRINLYIEINTIITNIIHQYVSDDDIHVYSIDELFAHLNKVKNLHDNYHIK
ncbi:MULTISPECIES: hypothetical protein [Enterococcus]|uniref:Y-family DNA polymerase n=1 Tax=Enterococcus TaxID=1350 RepID=UPI0032E3F1E8